MCLYERLKRRFAKNDFTPDEKSEMLERARNAGAIELNQYLELIKLIPENRPASPAYVGGCEGEI